MKKTVEKKKEVLKKKNSKKDKKLEKKKDVALIIIIVLAFMLLGAIILLLMEKDIIHIDREFEDEEIYEISYETENETVKEVIPVEEMKTIQAGQRATENSKYSDGTNIAIIPEGFTVSGIESEQNIDNGLVIYDIPASVRTVDWSTAKTKYNQFVWVPVRYEKTGKTKLGYDTGFRNYWKTTDWEANDEKGGQRSTVALDSKYAEPHPDYDKNDKTGLASQLSVMKKSVYKYGGFYIGRYEAGYEYKDANGNYVPRTGINSPVGKVVLRQDSYPYNYVPWGVNTNNIGGPNEDGSLPTDIGAVYLSKNMKLDCGSETSTTMLCSGVAWDAILDFVKDANHNVLDSTRWGNYKDSYGYDITRGSYYTASKWATISALPEQKYQMPSGSIILTTGASERSSILLTTGATERNSSKNIYDIAGNCYEWTTEASTSNYRVLRGGYCYGSGSKYPAAFRLDAYAVGSVYYYSFRPMLYIGV